MTRASVMGSDDPTNVTLPRGTIKINTTSQEVTGSNPERQDFIIGPNEASSFSGYVVARFDTAFSSVGVAHNTSSSAKEGEGSTEGDGSLLSGYVQFPNDTTEVTVRIGVSFISIEQARANLDAEIPDGQSFEETAYNTRKAWKDKLELIKIEGATKENLTTFYSSFYHTLQVRSFLLWYVFLY